MTKEHIVTTVQDLTALALEWYGDDWEDPIPAVDLYNVLPDFWDEWFNPILEGWSPEVRQELRSFFFREMQSDKTGIVARYTALAVYDGFIAYLTSPYWTKSLPEVSGWNGGVFTVWQDKSEKWQSEVLPLLKDDLSRIIQFVSPSQVETWRKIRWEISVACIAEDWDRAFQFYDRATQLKVIPERDIHLLLGQFQFLLAFRDAPIGALEGNFLEQNITALPRENMNFHPGNWMPEPLDSSASLLSVRFLARGLSVSEELPATQAILRGNVERAIVELEEANHLGPLTAPYEAALARCYFALYRFRDAARQYEQILEGNLPEPWSSLSIHIYGAAATSYLRAEDPTGAIRALQRCSLNFPTHADVYLRTAKLQAEQTDFEGVRGTLREAAEAVSGFDEDWRVSTLLALGELPPTEENLAAIKVDPFQRKIIEAVVGEYWPRFSMLSSKAREEWITGVALGHFLAQHQGFTEMLTQKARRSFIQALDLELDERVFRPLRKHFVEQKLFSDELGKYRDGGGDPDLMLFYQLVQRGRYPSLGQKSELLLRCANPSTPISAIVRNWLDEHHPNLPGHVQQLRPIYMWRNDDEHQKRGSSVRKDVIDDIPRTCRAVIASIETGGDGKTNLLVKL
jgi:tetratricopeptide (TPR) repeat protein